MILQPINNIAEICARKEVSDIILSPGSRCAPLTIAFARHPEIKVKTISDERAAAFIALGMAVTSGQVTGLVCTSGTAALNYAPAVAEAFYQEVPLLIFTADRPPEWIEQQDGQTIRQENLYGPHVKKSYSLPADLNHPDAVWQTERIISEAINEARRLPPGPVHINVPLREPFYPAADETFGYSQNIKLINEEPNHYLLQTEQLRKLQQEGKQYNRVLVVAGQHRYDQTLLQALQHFQDATGCVVAGDISANTHSLKTAVRHQDTTLTKGFSHFKELAPDLLITFGKSVLSKNLKLFLRQHKPLQHWHLQPLGPAADTFQTLTRIIRVDPAWFFSSYSTDREPDLEKTGPDHRFFKAWQQQESRAAALIRKLNHRPEYFQEVTAMYYIMQQLPACSNLHLANSMAVRYANLFALSPDQTIQVFANRGTSGIDGSTSTAVGSALQSGRLTILITGDLAFFYDRNGLWHNYLPENLRIILLNNQGGGIFRMIEGPRDQPELAELFETRQSLQAEHTARDFGMHYRAVSDHRSLQTGLKELFEAGKAAILEIKTDSRENARFFREFKKHCAASPAGSDH
jgi:2-succinyl-5-enolpyruvyl-6-hydroxy-3-cyclohexene-1-carboxylate synthase